MVDLVTLAELDERDTVHRREAFKTGRTQPKSTAAARSFEDEDDIAHVVKRRRLVGKQPSDRLLVDMYLPRAVIT